MRNRSTVLTFLCLALVFPCLSPAQKPPSTYSYTGNLSLDLAKVPFSRFGSYLAISQFLPDSNSRTAPGLYLRSMRGGGHNVFRLELLSAGSPVPFEVHASPSSLHLQAQAGSVDLCMPLGDWMRVRGKGVSLRLTAVTKTLTIPNADSHWEINTPPNEKYMLWPIAGALQVDAPWNGKGTASTVAVFVPNPASHRFDAEIDAYESVWDPHPAFADFAASQAVVQRDYRRWLARMPEVAPEFGPGAELAAYVDWAAVVAPSGYFKHPAMLMSKNWMDRLWSWDHCFNAMVLSYKDPELAWQQFELPFDNQEAHGALPDAITSTSREYSYNKPPIHGWTLMWMMKNGSPIDTKHLAAIYGPLSRWTDWFFKYRDSNGNGFPEYDHGNDSGWDNSTIMLSGAPVESPDLDSFLVLQMDELSSLAHTLGKEQDAVAWKSRSDQLLKKMLAKFWRSDHFVAFRAEDGAEIDSGSLQLYLPILLGNRLPAQVRTKLIAGLMRPGRFRTAHGFSTEPLPSSYYDPDGYWRGPIWAPTSMILAEGLDSAGEHALAAKLRADFCRMAQQNGMSENYNAVTGTGLRDPAYTWTSSVYLIFAHQLWEEPRTPASSPD
jgi:hypothetical protein